MKKILCLILSIVLVLCMTAPVMADQNLTAVHGLKKNTELLQRIASGDNYLVTIDLLDKDSKPDDGGEGDITIQWASGGVDHTHQFLTANALLILNQDGKTKAYSLLAPYATTLTYYSDWPDNYENDGGLYFSHFYNPYTGKTFLGSTTALTRFMTHVNNAKKYYAKSRPLAMQELGKAMHFLADINEPHHAALLIAGLSNHTTYENWADSTRSNYIVSTSGLYTSVPYDAKRYYTSYCTELFKMAARNAYGQASNASSSSEALWGLSAANTMGYAQESMAAFLYNFLYAVGAIRL